MLSDSVIYKTYRNGELVKTSPENGVSLIGIYEHNGLKRDEITNLNNVHNKYISGLDVYYGFDKVVSEDKIGEFTQISDNDGVINEHISVDGDFEKLDVLLVAHYDSPDIEGNGTTPVIVDHKELKVVRVATEDGKDAEFSIFRVHNQMDQIYVDINNHPFVDTNITTKLSLITQNGEVAISDDADITVEGVANISFSLDDSKLTITIPKDITVDNDITLTVTYGDQSGTILVKKMQGIVEYSLGSDRGYLRANSNEVANPTIIHKLVGSHNNAESEYSIVPANCSVIYFKNDVSISSFEAGSELTSLSTNNCKAGDFYKIVLYQNNSIIDTNFIEILGASADNIQLVLQNPFDQIYVDENGYTVSIDSLVNNSSESFYTNAYLYNNAEKIKLDIPKYPASAIKDQDFKIEVENNLLDLRKETCSDFLGIYFSSIYTAGSKLNVPSGGSFTIKYSIKYNGEWYSANQTIKVLTEKTDFDLYVGSPVFKYKDGKCDSM